MHQIIYAESGSCRYLKYMNLLSIFGVIATSTAASVGVNKNVPDFSVDLYKKTALLSKNQNFIVSPLSIKTCLGLLYMGAANATAQELGEVLRLGVESRKDTADYFEGLHKHYNTNPSLTLANKVYVQKGYDVGPEFKHIASASFDSDAEDVDFSENALAAENINHWVEEKTNHKIKNLVNEGQFNDATRAVLVNAVHFKGIWKYQFNPESTRKSDFYVDVNRTVQVDMMRVKGHFDYKLLHDLGAMAIKLPYKDSNVSMIILLPKSIEGLSQMEEKLQSVELLGLMKDMYRDEIGLHIPKFKVEFSIKLNEVLKNMGLHKIFSDEADFSNLLATKDPLKVTDVLHKAYIEVNEEGAEAAAATAAIIFLRSEFAITVDHPFYFAIVDDKSVLFEGRVVDFPEVI